LITGSRIIQFDPDSVTLGRSWVSVEFHIVMDSVFIPLNVRSIGIEHVPIDINQGLIHTNVGDSRSNVKLLYLRSDCPFMISPKKGRSDN
jgi:hypothetical protein